MDNEQLQLNGMVERVVFHNPENGWTVMEISANKQLETVVGVMPPVSVGETVIVKGKYVENPTYGKQFKAETLQRQMPNDEVAILRYLSSGAIKGIGPTTAQKIVRKFGNETLKIMEKTPSRLAEVNGISLKKAEEISEEFLIQAGLREAIMHLVSFGLTSSEAMRVWKRWGINSVEIVEDNPYILCSENLRIGFEKVDALCSRSQFSADDPRRLEASLIHVLRHNLQNGHTCVPRTQLVPVTAGAVDVEEEKIEDALTKMVENGTLNISQIQEKEYVFLPRYFDAEHQTAEAICQLINAKKMEKSAVGKWISIEEKKSKIVYEESQKLAIETALANHIMVLTGGPGTGKTTTLKAIIHLLKMQGEKVLLAAPTGRAAKRMSDLTGEDASTIHRLLEAQWTEEEEHFFARDRHNPLDADTIVVDEVSMMDSMLFFSLLDAFPKGGRLIMVGDSNQLPAVGPGNVLADLIDSGKVPVVHLQTVFRQALESRIVYNAHRIIEGESPELNGPDSDFFMLQRHTLSDTADTVVDLCCNRLPNKYKTDVFGGIQLLTPGKKGRLGTEELNLMMQRIANPPAEEKTEWKIGGRLFREGDKVMQVQNDYQIHWTRDREEGQGVYNGDIGVLTSISKRDESLTVQLDDGREVIYSRTEAENLELAYCITIHKSQGSEFDIVVVPLFDVSRMLQYRNLLYTAVTRAKNLLVLVGEKHIVDSMVSNERKTKRYSALKYFIQDISL